VGGQQAFSSGSRGKMDKVKVGKALPWVETGRVWENDHVTRIPNVGKKTAEKLATIDVLMVRQLLDADIYMLTTLYARTKVDKWMEDASGALPGDAPPNAVVNHKLAANTTK
jgi:hypothetical protein